MMMGFRTSSMSKFSKNMRAALLLMGEFSHVLMRTPL